MTCFTEVPHRAWIAAAVEITIGVPVARVRKEVPAAAREDKADIDMRRGPADRPRRAASFALLRS